MNFTSDTPNFLDGEIENEREEDDASEESSGSTSDSEDDNDENDDNEEDEETYIRFVRSVFCDDLSGCSNTEDEDEEEEDYEPDQKDGEDNDDDSDEDDRDLIRIQNRELRELVDGCWQTIVGEAPPVQSVHVKDEGDGGDIYELGSPTRIRSNQIQVNHTSPVANTRNGVSRQDDRTIVQGNSKSSVCDEIDEDIEMNPSVSPVKGIAAQANGTKLMPIPSGVSTGPNAISTMVSKLLLENDTTEVCVEGLPVTAIRNIVARQMSMATQLLTQILLQADEDSDCFTKGYTSLMELSNLREAALKKASLVQMNFRNATTIRHHSDLLNQKKALNSIIGSDRSDRSDYNDEGDSDSESEVAEEDSLGMQPSLLLSRPSAQPTAHRTSKLASVPIEEPNADSSNVIARRLTRSAMPQGAAVHTMFNMPILGKVSTLFDMVDLSRKKIKAQLAQHRGLIARNGNYSEKELKADSKARLLEAIRVQVHSIMPRLNMRSWRCLVPTPRYPLPAPLMRSLDPSTLMGRCLFTPAEDDLLLRGIMILGDSDWEQIRTAYMPSKVAQTLQFRYTQMTSLTASMEDNNYKRYQKLEADYRNRDTKWSPEEELELLRAFQVFGNRWPLVRIFYFPHRKLSQLKLKWTSLQKTWQRAYQGGQAAYPRTGIKKELTDSMRTFLQEISPAVTVPPEPVSCAPISEVIAGMASQPSAPPASLRTAAAAASAVQSITTANEAPSTSGGSHDSGMTGIKELLGAASASRTDTRAPHTVSTPVISGPLPSISSVNVPSSLPQPFPGPTAQAAQMAQMQQQMQQFQQMPGIQGMSGMPGMPGMFPFGSPFMLQQSWAPPNGGKIPTTQAEFQMYLQQQQMLYQQFIQHQQYQIIMHQQQMMSQQHQQQQLQSQNQNNSGSSSVPSNLLHHPPLQASAQNINPNLPTSVPPSSSATVNEVIQRAPPSAGAGNGASSAAAFCLDGPLLLKPASEPPKRVRRIKPDLVSADPVLRSPGSSRSENNLGNSATEAEKRVQDSSAPVHMDENSRSVSFLHDQDSMFSILCGQGNSVAFGEPDGLSIPYLSSDNSSSREPAAPPSNQTAPTQKVAAEPPTLKGILSKPKKKTIRPTLISATSAGVAAHSAFDAVRSAPGATAAEANLNTFNGVASSSAKNSSTLSNKNQNMHRMQMGASVSESLEEESSRSLLGLEGLSCLNWPEAPDSSSSGADDSLSMNPNNTNMNTLADISLLDASKFSFSNFAPPRFEESRAEDSRASRSSTRSKFKNGKSDHSESTDSKSRSKTTSKNSTSSSSGSISNKSKNKAPTAGAASTPTKPIVRSAVGSPILTRSLLGSPSGDHSLFHFDETSNMSLLGDLFGDGDLGPQAGYSNISQLLNVSRPPLHSALNSPVGARRPPLRVPDQSNNNINNNNNRKRGHSAAEKTSESAVRPFQNIGERSSIATAGTISHNSSHNSSSVTGPSPKKQKKSGGLFAAVMAKARR